MLFHVACVIVIVSITLNYIYKAWVFIPDFGREISVAEMEEVFNKLKENKAPDDDGIPPGVFKGLDSTLIEIMAILFNNVMRSGEYPNCWSTGNICPIHKSGPKQDTL